MNKYLKNKGKKDLDEDQVAAEYDKLKKNGPVSNLLVFLTFSPYRLWSSLSLQPESTQMFHKLDHYKIELTVMLTMAPINLIS